LTSSEREPSRFLVPADRLFTGEGLPSDLGRRWLARYLAVAESIAAIVVVRRVDAITNPQFWAEDGCFLFYENLMFGFPRALRTLHFGYPYLTQRLVALVGGLLPLSAAPRVYTSSGRSPVWALGRSWSRRGRPGSSCRRFATSTGHGRPR
jgi:hypothetical protein